MSELHLWPMGSVEWECAAEERIAKLEIQLAEAESALALIAAPMRPDGTWNRDREACRVLAAETLEAMK